MSDNKIFSYTKRDYESSRKEGLSQLPTISNGVWTDLNATDPGIIMLDYVHSLVDMINYYQDHQALESFITTAKERANIFRLAKQLGYKIRSATSSQVYVKFYVDEPYEKAIKIPAGTKVATKNEVEFHTVEDAYLQANTTEVSVLCKQGTVYTKTYEGTGISRFSAIEPPGNINQYIILTADNIDIDTIKIVDNLGRVWDSVDSIVFSTGEDRVYQVELTPDDTVRIDFGDGERGMVPQETDILTITYTATSSEDGNVSAGTLTELNTMIQDSAGNYIPFKVINEEESLGGSSAQSSESIRELALGAIKAQDRAVTLSDFENLAKLVPGVANAIAYDINVKPDIPHNEVKVLIIPEGNQTKVLLNRVNEYLSARMIPPTNLTVSYPSGTEINISVTVKSLGSIGQLEYDIRNLVTQYFKDRASEIGEDFYPTDLSTEISKLENVRYIVSMKPSTIVDIPDGAVAALGNLEITVQ